jgi:hypothetical protein
MRLTKALGAAGALIVAALVGGTLIGSALATDETDGTDSTSTGTAYCETFRDALASELGVTVDELVAAGQAAANATIDAAVAAGDLDEDRADELRERIAEADGSECIGFGHAFGGGFERGTVRGFLGGDVFEAAADALGLESADLIGELRDAGSLEALAEAQAVSYDEVKASILAAVQADLDAAVAEGLEQERADEVIERLTTWLDEGGQVGDGPGLGLGWHHRGPLNGGPFGPWGDDDPDDDDAEDSGA